MQPRDPKQRALSGLVSSLCRGVWLLGIFVASGLLSTAMVGCYIDLQPLPGCDNTSQHSQCTQDSSQPEIPPEPAFRCGDGTCDTPDEHCGNCPSDCPCATDQRCQGDRCQDTARCGDGTCDDAKGENCTSCPGDCACPADRTCRQGQCLQQCLCTPTQNRCHNGAIETCKADCLGWDVVKTCQPADQLVCEPLTWVCKCKQTCTVGERRCISKTEVEECIKDDPCSRLQTLSCNKGESCVKGQCCECTPGETRCNGQTYDQTCGADCRWKSKRSCKDNNPLSICLGGKCI